MPGLVIDVQANLQKFEDGMRAVGEVADNTVSAVEQRFRNLNADISPALDKLTSAVAPQASEAGSKIGLLIGGGIIAGIIGLSVAAGAAIYQMVGSLSKLGDRADDLRLPVTVLQALSLAAADARVKTGELDSALDKFTAVSKTV